MEIEPIKKQGVYTGKLIVGVSVALCYSRKIPFSCFLECFNDPNDE